MRNLNITPRCRAAWLCLALAGFFTPAFVSAQDAWAQAVSPTTQELWGVTYGAGQFVAVGRAGTILTSPDGRQWTARSSGTTQWLTAVTYGAEARRFVAVGEEGRVFVSTDGIDWQPRATPVGTPRLNAVNYAWGRFTAVGERKALLWSEDGDTWYAFTVGQTESTPWLRGLTHTPAGFFAVGQDGVALRWTFRSSQSGTTETSLGADGLEGVAYGRGTIVAVGAGGSVWRWSEARGSASAVSSGVVTGLGAVTFADNLFVAAGDGGLVLVSDDGVTWAARVTPTAQSLRALAASPQAVVAVGLGGAIVRSEFTPRAPRIVSSPARDLVERDGSGVMFAVAASGTEPLAYQWRRDGVLVAGETDATLLLAGVTAAQAGDYTVEVRNAAGAATGRVGRLSLTHATLPTGLVDPLFAPTVSGAVRAIQPLADGRVIIAGDFSYARPGGGTQQGIARLTSTGQFDPSFDVGEGVSGGNASTLAVQPDGKILVGGAFTSVRGQAQSFLVRLNSDGSVDASFSAAAVLAAPTQLAVLTDGRILVADGSEELRWLRSDGAVSQTSARLLFPSGIYSGGSPLIISRFDVLTDGRVVVAGPLPDFVSSGRVVRLRPDGSVDATFAANRTVLAPSVTAVRALANGSVVVAARGTASRLGSQMGPTTLVQVDETGAVVRLGPEMPSVEFGAGAAVLLYPDGRAIMSSNLSRDVVPLPSGPVTNSLLRFGSDGAVDETFLLGPGVDGNVFAIVPAADGGVYVGGAFTSVAGVARTRLAKLGVTGTNPTLPRIASIEPRYQEVRVGESFSLRAAAGGTGPLKLSWSFRDENGINLNQAFRNSSTEVLTMTALDQRFTGYYSIVVEAPAGVTVSEVAYVKVVAANAPVITTAPAPQRANVGRPASIAVTVADPVGATFQWSFKGTPIAGATNSSIFIERASLGDAGTYSVVVTNGLGSARGETTLAVVEAPVLVNLSTRAFVEGGDRTLIVGFVVDRYKNLTVRAVGPTLTRFGVAAPLADPQLAVYDATGKLLSENDNWNDAPGAPSTLQTGFTLPERSKDAAYPANASGAGAYTMHVTSVDGARGVALGEIYEDPSSQWGRLINLSTRAFVGTGESVAIPGFALRGPGKVRLLVRGVGPGLNAFGVSGVLANPTLTVFDEQARVLATNDDWSVAADASEVTTVSARVGAFALPAGSRDAALLIELPAGNYTAQVSGVGGTSGVTLVEVYEVP